MSDFREASHRLIESSLRCPKCPAANRPGTIYIELDADCTRAYCTVCSCSGPVAAFQLPGAKETVGT